MIDQAGTKIVRVYTGPDGRSHFEDLVVPMRREGDAHRYSFRSQLLPLASMLFRENHAEGAAYEYHNPKQRQFVVTIVGAAEIIVDDDTRESRILGPCGILFAEDTTGRGHRSRELVGPRKSLIIRVPDDFDIHQWAQPA